MLSVTTGALNRLVLMPDKHRGPGYAKPVVQVIKVNPRQQNNLLYYWILLFDGTNEVYARMSRKFNKRCANGHVLNFSLIRINECMTQDGFVMVTNKKMKFIVIHNFNLVHKGYGQKVATSTSRFNFRIKAPSATPRQRVAGPRRSTPAPRRSTSERNASARLLSSGLKDMISGMDGLYVGGTEERRWGTEERRWNRMKKSLIRCDKDLNKWLIS